MKSIPFFTDTVKIKPHSASGDNPQLIDRPVAIGEFVDGAPCALYELYNGDLLCATVDGRFIEGPEYVE